MAQFPEGRKTSRPRSRASFGLDRTELVVSSDSEYGTPEGDFKGFVRDKFPSISSQLSKSDDSEGYESPVGGEVTLASKPSLLELRELPVTSWYVLGLQLEVRQQELERIQLKYNRDVKLCRTKMFGVWRREGDNPSYEKLLQGLLAVGRSDLVEAVCRKLGLDIPTQGDSHHSKDAHRLRVSDMPPLVEIVSKHAYKWNDIGLALGFTTPELRNIASKITLLPGAPGSFLEDLLNEWVQWPNEAHPVSPTIVALEAALQSRLVGLGAFSGTLKRLFQGKQVSLKRFFDQRLSQPRVQLPENVQKYATFLKSKYLDALPLMPTGEWPPNTGRHHCELTMIERARDSLPDQESMEERSKAISQGQVEKVSENERVIKCLDDVLDKDSSRPLKVLMEGVPGVGKSTLVRKSCKDWAEGVALLKFQLVLLLTLKEQNIRCAESLEDLVVADDPNLKAKVVRHLQKTSGKHVLFIFDGFNELNEEEQSFFLKLLQGEQLHKCSIILTSRSYAIEDLKYEEWIHRHVEVLGFTEKQIDNYIMQNIADKSKANTLATSMKEEMSLTSVSYTPLNCSILLYIFQQGKYKLPSSLTELFESFVFSLLKRHSKKLNTVFGKVRHRSLNSLPKPLDQQFSALCKLAYRGMIEGKFVFSHQNVRTAFVHHDVFEQNMESSLLSLLISTTSFDSVGGEQQYQFLHLAIQEFLAAKYLANQQEDEQKRFLSNNWTSPRMRSMLVFYAGITGLDGRHFKNFFVRVLCSGYLDALLQTRAPAYSSNTTLHQEQCVLNPAPLVSLGPKSLSSVKTMSLQKGHSIQKPATTEPSVPFNPVPLWGDHSLHKANISAEHVPYASSLHSGRYRHVSKKHTKHSPRHVSVPVSMQVFLNIASMLAEVRNCSLYDYIYHQVHIHTIQLGYCRLATVDCIAIAKFISKCPYPLETISFCFCNLTHQSMEIFCKASSSTTHHCLKKCNKVELNYCAPSISSALSLLPQIHWFQHTRILHLNDLRYPKGLHPESFHLHSLLALNNLTDLTVIVVNVPTNHLSDYEAVFLKFVGALRTYRCLKHFTYNQTPAGTCVSLMHLMSALSHTSIQLTLGHTKVVTATSVSIPASVCFSICSNVLSSALKLANARGIKRLQVHQHNIFLPCHICQTSVDTTSCDQCNHHQSLTSNSETFSGSQEPFSVFSRHTAKSECTHLENPAKHISAALAENKTIQMFDVSGCNATDNAAQCIASRLGENKVLNVLKMNSHCLTSDGAVYLLKSLNQNKTLNTLHLFGLELKVTYDPYCLTMMCSSTSSDSAIVNILMALLQDTGVEECIIERSDTMIGEEVQFALEEMLAVNTTLNSLQLTGCRLDDATAVHIASGLAENHSVTRLKLSLKCAGAVHILNSLIQNKNTTLEDLDLTFNDLQLQQSSTLEIIGTVLSVNTSLTKLHLTNCKLNNAVAAHIATGLTMNKSVKTLDLSCNSIATAGIVNMFNSLEFNTSLVEIDLAFNDLWLHQSEARVLRNVLTTNQTLRVIRLGHCGLDDEVAGYIATGLSKNHSLTTLDLSHNSSITSAGAVSIFKSLTRNCSLEELDLSFIDLLTTEELQAVHSVLGSDLGNMLADNKALKYIHLRHCRLNDEVAAEVAIGLASNQSVKLLNLSRNCFTSAGAVHIFKSLSKNKCLEELNLSLNDFQLQLTSVKGEIESLGSVVQEMLVSNHTMRSLNLQNCKLSHVVTSHIKEVSNGLKHKCLCIC